MVIKCSVKMYKCYSCLRFLPIKHNNEVKDIDIEVLNNIPHLMKNNLVSTVFSMVFLCI